MTTDWDTETSAGPRRVALPLDPIMEWTSTGCLIRVPVRAEQVRVGRRTVVREEVRLKTRSTIQVVRPSELVRREVADIALEGEIELARDERGFPTTEHRG